MKNIICLLAAALFVLSLSVSCNKDNKDDDSDAPGFLGDWYSQDRHYYYKVTNSAKEGYYLDYYYKSLEDLKANKEVQMSDIIHLKSVSGNKYEFEYCDQNYTVRSDTPSYFVLSGDAMTQYSADSPESVVHFTRVK